MKKLLALLIIATFLMSIPLVAAANTKPSLSKVVFIHRREDFAKPPDTPGKGPPSDGDIDYYAFLGKGVKWKELPVTYVINPENPDELSVEDITTAISSAAEEWDSHTSEELFNDVCIIDYAATIDLNNLIWNGDNEIVFGDYPEEGVIAVCIVWGYFRGPPTQREIIEFDIMFDIDFTWGYAGETSETELGDTDVMDLQNIVTHEFGHGVGLADLYDNKASEQTMYGYATEGETKKRTLESGDIAGIQALYGE
ncbi:hypothetical protein ES707_15856 [subsurface metagenome]